MNKFRLLLEIEASSAVNESSMVATGVLHAICRICEWKGFRQIWNAVCKSYERVAYGFFTFPADRRDLLFYAVSDRMLFLAEAL